MTASINDKFKKVGVAGTLTTLASPGKALAAASLNGNSLTNWPTDTGIIFAIRTVDDDGVFVSGTYTEWYGTVSGNTISNLTLAYGTDQVYAAGSNVQLYIPLSAKSHNDLVDGLVQDHDQLGYHSKALSDANGNEWLNPNAIASAVNNFLMSNAATGNDVDLGVEGSDSNIGQSFTPKGTGQIYSKQRADGWVVLTDSWSYSAWDSGTKIAQITVPTDATVKYSPGMRVRFTQPTDGVKYGIIVKVEATTLHVFMHDDDDFDNEDVTSPSYSTQKIPFGFDADPSKWQIVTTDTSSRSQASPTASQWYNLGSLGITVPIGAWLLGYEVCLGLSRTANQGNARSTLSTANNSQSDAELTTNISIVVTGNSGGATTGLNSQVKREKPVILTAEDDYYLNAMSTYSTLDTIAFAGDAATTKIYARCAYL